MAVGQRPDEPVVVYTVRQLLDELRGDLRMWMAEVSSKLDDRVTVGVFKAVRSDVDALASKVARLETAAETRKAVTDRQLAWAGLIVALLAAATSIAWLIHG